MGSLEWGGGQHLADFEAEATDEGRGRPERPLVWGFAFTGIPPSQDPPPSWDYRRSSSHPRIRVA
jgi:hypothetical protein